MKADTATTSGSLRVLVADDDEIIHQMIKDHLADCGHVVIDAHNGTAALEQLKTVEVDLALIDFRMPGMNGIEVMKKAASLVPGLPMVVITGHGSMHVAVEAMRAGASDFLTKPLKIADLDKLLHKQMQNQKLAVNYAHQVDRQRNGGDRLVGESAAMNRVREQIKLMANSPCDTVLISGDTGTGKEVVAREIHRLAGGAERPFIAVNCPAIPDQLVESEFFGHERGSFTGAAEQHIGCFERANGGTLFLDEVSDLSPSAQSKLLRALETRTIRRVGGYSEIVVNLRVIAATNAPLGVAVEEGRFRSDLFYRLNIFSIHLIPLDQRRDDIVPLAKYFVRKCANRYGMTNVTFSESAFEHLQNSEYPGNVRQLKNMIERAVIQAGGNAILPLHLEHGDSVPPAAAKQDERALLLDAMERAKWNRREAARLLSLSYPALRYRLKKYQLD